MLKGVIFDMDGVVVDSHPIHIKAWKRLLDSAGVVAADQELDIVREGKTKEEILRYFMGSISTDDMRAYGEDKDRLYREEARELKTVKGVRRLLNQLSGSGISVAVASSGSAWRVDQTLETFGLKDYFSVVVSGSEFPTGKSDCTIFFETAQRMRVECQSVLVFEDSVEGTKSATSLGMKCVGIGNKSRANGLLAVGAERVVPDFTEISLKELQGLFVDHSDANFLVASSLSR